MIHVVISDRVGCPMCSQPVYFTCVWYDAEADDLEHSQSEPGKKGEDKPGDYIEKDAPKVFVGKWIKCSAHKHLVGAEIEECRMSGHAPENLGILGSMARRIKNGYGKPPFRPGEDEFAKKSNAGHHPQRSKKQCSGRQARKKVSHKKAYNEESERAPGENFDLYQEVLRDLRRRGLV